MENEREQPKDTGKKEEGIIANNDNLFSHALSSAAFATVGAKLSYLGVFHDIDDILGKEKVSVWQKVKWSVDGTLLKKTQERIEHLRNSEQKSALVAYLKATKHSTMLMVLGGAIGAVAGWVRGGLIKDWHNIYEHPWDSTKVIIGLEKPEIMDKYNKKKEEPIMLAHADSKSISKDDSSKWRDYVAKAKSLEHMQQTMQP